MKNINDKKLPSETRKHIESIMRTTVKLSWQTDVLARKTDELLERANRLTVSG